ncbi:MAG: hypothetical protein Kow00109_15410 [Acidobacteriota bacterium]
MSKRKRRLSPRVFAWGKLSLLVAVLGTVFLLSMVVGMRLAVRINEVATPSVVGMSLDDAKVLLERAGLQVAVAARRYDATVPEGDILTQSPGAGIPMRKGGTVRVVVSLGRRSQPVPRVEGITLRAARLVLQQAGYELGRVARLPLPGAEEKIVGQWPDPGSEARTTNRVDVLVVEKAPRRYVTPRFQGRNLNLVLRELNELGFPSRVTYREAWDYAKGTVIRQHPEPGEPLAEGETILLEVAR